MKRNEPAGKNQIAMLSKVAERADRLIRIYYDDPNVAERAAEELVCCLRGPMIQRLRERGFAGDLLEELSADAAAHLAAGLHRSRQAGASHIENAIAYAVTVADRVASDHFRRTRPNWHHLKRHLVGLLDGRVGHKLFARWKLRLEWLGGFQRWKGRPFRPTERYAALCVSHMPFEHEALNGRSPETVPLVELTARLFAWIDTPLEVDNLIRRIAALQGIEDEPPLSLQGLVESGAAELSGLPVGEAVDKQVLSALACEQMRVELWSQIRILPLRQRHALILSMARDELLLVANSAGDAACALVMPLTGLAQIWAQLPLPDRIIAARLEATEKQVRNLRLAARARLARWLVRNSSEDEW